MSTELRRARLVAEQAANRIPGTRRTSPHPQEPSQVRHLQAPVPSRLQNRSLADGYRNVELPDRQEEAPSPGGQSARLEAMSSSAGSSRFCQYHQCPVHWTGALFKSCWIDFNPDSI